LPIRGFVLTSGLSGDLVSSVAIDRRGPEDAEQLFALYRDVFGEALVESSRHRWRWQYLENPHTGSEGPAIWVARDEAGPLGQYASMPVRLWWGGREVRSSWGMDVFLRPEARGRGIGARLFTAWSDHVEVALGLGLTPSSYGLFKKLQYADVGPVPFYVRVLDAGKVARRRLGGVLGTLAGPLLGAGLGLLRPEGRHPESAAVEVRGATGFGPEYDTLWERVRESYRMCVRRDAAYLDWKYRRCPNREYRVREARREGELVGFCVTREDDYRGLRLGWLLDVFADARDAATRDALIGDALEGFRAGGVARAQAFSLHAGLGADLSRRGFRRGESPMQFCVRSRVESEGVFEHLGDWHVVFGDSDMDR
jgi:GNAT superfamily N-acetyltransferase